jgi:glycosyltransferase involved in cell wall biosynthesis
MSVSSAEIGFGISSATALKSGLAKLGFSIVEVRNNVSSDLSKLEWIYECYKQLDALQPQQHDVVIIFHSLIHFPGEVRRLINHHTKRGCPVLAYAHGSHWDPTDSIRAQSSPGLLMQDLANLLTGERLLLVSNFYYDRLRTQLSTLGPSIQERFQKVARVVGLPIDTESIDRLETPRHQVDPGSAVHILFNHALRRPKRPDVALSVIDEVLRNAQNCMFHITRSLHPEEQSVEATLREVASRHPGRIVHHGTLSLKEYYKLLWECDIQFSTAEHESFGVSTVEAMYTHNACFTPKRESYPEVTAGIGNYDDPEDLVRCLLTAVEHSRYRMEIADAQQLVAQKFSGLNVATNISAVMKEILTSSS